MEFLGSLVTAIWFAVALPTHLALAIVSTPLGAISFGNAFLHEDEKVYEPIVIMLGPTYSSWKTDYPGTEMTSWVYFGDEPEGWCNKHQRWEYDENTIAFRWESEFDDTHNMRGDETGDRCRSSYMREGR